MGRLQLDPSDCSSRLIWYVFLLLEVCHAGYSFRMTAGLSKTIQCASLLFQRIDYIHRCNSLMFSKFGACNSVLNKVFQKHFQHTTSLFVNQTRDSLHSASAGFVIPWMLSRKTFLCCLAPPSPRLFPPFPQPVIVSLS